MRIGFVSFSWGGGFDYRFAVRRQEETHRVLAPLGEVLGPERPIDTPQQAREAAAALEAAHIDALILQQGTFCSAEPLPVLVERLHVPILLWAVKEPFQGGSVVANSLCGVQLMAGILKRLGRDYRYVYGDPGDPACDAQVQAFVRAADAAARLRRLRIGLVGSRAPGFYPLAVDELALRAQIGPELVHIDLSEVFFSQEASEPELQAAEREVGEGMANLDQVPPEKLRKVARTLAMLRRMTQRLDLGALAVKCWPEFTEGYGVAACSTLSRLASGGMVAGCEGDVNGTVTSVLLSWLAQGEIPFLADLIQVEPADNTGLLWHCGVAAPELAAEGQPISFGFEFGGVGMNVEFALKPGRITVARLGALNGRYRLLVTGGEALPTPLLARGTMAKVRFDAPAQRLLDTIILGGWEHHVSMIYGDVRGEMAALAGVLGIECTCL